MRTSVGFGGNAVDAMTEAYAAQGILLERMIGSILREDYDVWRWLQAEDPKNRQDILIFNISGCMALVFSWHDSGYQKTPEQMVALIAELMNKPLARQNP